MRVAGLNKLIMAEAFNIGKRPYESDIRPKSGAKKKQKAAPIPAMQ